MKYLLVIVLLIILFSNTGFSQVKGKDTVVIIHHKFDEKAVSWFSEKGTGKIKGNASFKSKGGAVRSGSQFAVELMPFSAYAEERLSKIYLARDSGAVYVEDGVPKFLPDPIAYHNTIKATCDEHGNFEFSNLPAGEYYVIAFMLWDNKELKTGGALMRRLILTNGVVKKIQMKNF